MGRNTTGHVVNTGQVKIKVLKKKKVFKSHRYCQSYLENWWKCVCVCVCLILGHKTPLNWLICTSMYPPKNVWL